MANRNSVQRMIPGNALGSVLRETAREARRSQRGDAEPGCCDEVATLQAQVAALQAVPTPKRVYYARLFTDGTGTITWTFPSPFLAEPHVFASPIGGFPLFCSVVSPNAVSTQVKIWGSGGAPVGAGFFANIMAVESL